MANASVEKLKALGIRHGEKAVVGLTATVFVVFTAMAIIKPTLDMKPDDLSSAANSASSNLAVRQDDKDILAKLEADGLKEPNFQKIIQNQIANALKPGDYRSKMDWVTPEPGAGLIRDQPELIAPTELSAFPGRGGILMYALNEKGDRVIETSADALKKNGRRGTGGGGMPGMMGRSGGRAGTNRPETAEEKKRKELEEENRKKAFAGAPDPEKGKEKAKADEPDGAAQGPWKEETKGKRWIVITGVIDNAKMRKNYLLALKNDAIAYPNYKRIEAERQTRQSDGSWTEWAPIDQDKNYAVLDNLPELDTEYVPETQRPQSLNDPLPFLKAGYWTGVHVAKLVPAEVLETPKQAANTVGMMGGGGKMGMGGASGGSGPMGGGISRPGGSGAKMGAMGGSGPMGGMKGAMGEVGGGGGNAGEMNFTKLDEANIMLRALDFTIEPDNAYRFRVRIVVANPNHDHTDVNPGVDVESKELFGPWSEPTELVTVPADVSAYAQSPEPATRRDDLVSFQVIRWDPGSGQTVVKNDIAGPGEVIGEFGPVPMPSSEGTGVKSANIDFNSRAIVLDTFGGRQKMPDIGLGRNAFEVPALAMIVEPDGAVVVRSQAGDKADEVRQDMDANYKQALKDSDAARPGGSKKPGARGRGKKRGSRPGGSGGRRR